MLKYTVDETFIKELFAHTAFQSKLTQFCIPKSSTGHQRAAFSMLNSSQSNCMHVLVEDICSMLAEQYKQKVDSQCLNLYQSQLAILKQVEQIKSSLYSFSPTKSEITTAEKEKQMDISLLSEVSIDFDGDPLKMRRNIEDAQMRFKDSSFISSFAYQGGQRQVKEELEEKINASILNFSGDMAKFEASVQEKLKGMENSVNRKMESVYKTLTSVIETMNDLQSRHLETIKKDEKQDKLEKQQKLQKIVETKLAGDSNNREKKVLPITNVSTEEVPNRRRSFLGFLKY